MECHLQLPSVEDFAGSDATGKTTANIVGIVADVTDRVVVATSNGKLAIRDGGAWTTTIVRAALPAPRPGSPAAVSML